MMFSFNRQKIIFTKCGSHIGVSVQIKLGYTFLQIIISGVLVVDVSTINLYFQL